MNATAEIIGIRTNCLTGKKQTRRITVEVHEGIDGLVFAITKGGVTGFESFYIEHGNLGKMSKCGWCACMGTEGRWDGLTIGADQMRIAFKKLGLGAHAPTTGAHEGGAT